MSINTFCPEVRNSGSINSRLRLQVAQLFSPLWLCAGSNTFRLRYLAPESTIFPQCGSYWSAIWGSNSWLKLGRLQCYHYTNGTHARVFLPRIPRSPLNLGFQISYSVAFRATYSHLWWYLRKMAVRRRIELRSLAWLASNIILIFLILFLLNNL